MEQEALLPVVLMDLPVDPEEEEVVMMTGEVVAMAVAIKVVTMAQEEEAMVWATLCRT